jgi:hypothetical protein
MADERQNALRHKTGNPSSPGFKPRASEGSYVRETFIRDLKKASRKTKKSRD